MIYKQGYEQIAGSVIETYLLEKSRVVRSACSPLLYDLERSIREKAAACGVRYVGKTLANATITSSTWRPLLWVSQQVRPPPNPLPFSLLLSTQDLDECVYATMTALHCHHTPALRDRLHLWSSDKFYYTSQSGSPHSYRSFIIAILLAHHHEKQYVHTHTCSCSTVQSCPDDVR